MVASEAQLNLDCTYCGWSALNCWLFCGGCSFFWGITAFVLFSWVRIQDMLAEEEDFLFAPAPGDAADLGGYGYGQE